MLVFPVICLFHHVFQYLPYVYRFVFTIETAQSLATTDYEQIKPKLKKPLQTKFSEHAGSLMFTVNQLNQDFCCLNMRFVNHRHKSHLFEDF